MKMRIAVMMLAGALLAGCGLAETAATSAATGESAAEEAKAGKKMQEEIKSDIATMQQQEKAAREAAEAAATGE